MCTAVPSLEEVVARHLASKSRAQEQDANLRRLRADHLKARGDEAINQGNYRLAWERYSEALALHPDKAGLHTLYSNRSLAYCKARRHGEALADADAAARLAPRWHKAHWRRAAALAALRRGPEAVLAYRDAWRAARGGDAEGEAGARLWAAVQRLTREQLARSILTLLGKLQAAGKLEAPKVEEATEQEQAEALFRALKVAHQGQPRPWPYYRRYLCWLQQGLQPAEAYLERAAVHAGARCYLQAREDAKAAIAALRAQQRQQAEQAGKQGNEQPGEQAVGEQLGEGGGSGSTCGEAAADVSADLRSQLALAYQRLGEACLAERGHADRDCRAAAKAFLQAAEVESAQGGSGSSAAVQEGLQEASETLTLQDLDQIQLELYHEGPADGGPSSAGSPAAAGLQPGQRLFRVALTLAFPKGTAGACTARARELLRGGVASAAGVDPRRVSFEGISAPAPARGRRHLAVHLGVQVGPDLLKASQLAKAITGSSTGSSANSSSSGSSSGGSAGEDTSQHGSAAPTAAAALPTPEQLAALLGGEELAAALGRPDPQLCSVEIEDVTPACAAGASEAEHAQQAARARGEAGVGPEHDRRLAVPARPKLELELPYRQYRLVRADGGAAERPDKHPFSLSRVYYDASEKPEEVWAELGDGSCRWRQTGGEVKVLALRVPAELPTKQLAVDIQPYSLKVWNRTSGEVYLEGELERGVVPEDCFWTHCGGAGEDGCALYLRKMNLELLQKHWLHSEMWWPRLFRGHAQIAWDDYEKDYSDLPEEVLARHRVAEAIKDDERRAETGEREKREALQEKDDLRKRTRQERLAELRSGTRRSWVELNRALPAVDAF